MKDIMTELRGLVGGYTPAERVLDHHPDFQVKHVDDLLRRAADEIERLTKERDEARLEVCQCDNTRFGARQEAIRRGWDCFKDTP
jgi:hypothetical protein